MKILPIIDTHKDRHTGNGSAGFFGVNFQFGPMFDMAPFFRNIRLKTSS